MAPKAGNKRVTRQSAGEKLKAKIGEESNVPKKSKVVLADEISETPTAETPEIIATSDELESGAKRSISFRSPDHKRRYESSVSKKKVMVEKPVDIPLFTQINIKNMFSSIDLDTLIDPPKRVFPHLVREFYANLSVNEDHVIISEIKGMPFMANPSIFGMLLNIPSSGPNPYIKNAPCEAFEKLPLASQHEIICGKPPPYPGFKPTLTDLTPISSLLLKVIHANLVPRSGSRDKVTYLDTILLACLQSGTPFNMASLMIDHMAACVEHRTHSLPYAALLTNVFEYMRVIALGELSFNLREYIDAETLQASNLVIAENGKLVWANVPETFTTTRMNPPVGHGDANESIIKLTLYQLEHTVKDNCLSLEDLKIKLATCLRNVDALSEYSQISFENLTSQMIKMEKAITKQRKMMEFEFQSFQDGLVRTAKAWNHELLKLAVNNSRELIFLSKQICGASALSSEPLKEWYQFNWFGEKQVTDLDPKLPLPVMPPPEVFGLSREEYTSKITGWLAARDLTPPDTIKLSDHFMEIDIPEAGPSSTPKKPSKKAAGGTEESPEPVESASTD